jgi:hypothetical protein
VKDLFGKPKKLLKTKSRTKTELLKVSSARRRARQAALEALLAEGKVIRIDKEYFANDPSGSVEQLIHAEAVRLEADLRSVPELLSRSGKKLRRAMKDRTPTGRGDRTSRFQAASYSVLMVFQTDRNLADGTITLPPDQRHRHFEQLALGVTFPLHPCRTVLTYLRLDE